MSVLQAIDGGCKVIKGNSTSNRMLGFRFESPYRSTFRATLKLKDMTKSHTQFHSASNSSTPGYTTVTTTTPSPTKTDSSLRSSAATNSGRSSTTTTSSPPPITIKGIGGGGVVRKCKHGDRSSNFNQLTDDAVTDPLSGSINPLNSLISSPLYHDDDERDANEEGSIISPTYALAIVMDAHQNSADLPFGVVKR